MALRFFRGDMRPSDDIPPFLLPLRERAAAFADIAAAGLQQILINEYAPGAGIGWHRDKSMFEDVVAISLGSTCSLRLRRRQGSGWERDAQEGSPALSLSPARTRAAGVGA
jgi:alkylated DNA repair dioxygenase AlkB